MTEGHRSRTEPLMLALADGDASHATTAASLAAQLAASKERIVALEEAATRWRVAAGALSCKHRGVGPSGGFCLDASQQMLGDAGCLKESSQPWELQITHRLPQHIATPEVFG